MLSSKEEKEQREGNNIVSAIWEITRVKKDYWKSLKQVIVSTHRNSVGSREYDAVEGSCSHHEIKYIATNNNISENRDKIILKLLNPVDRSKLTLNDFNGELSGFLNTGMLKIWPAEFALSAWCITNLHLFEGKSVLELGAGMTGYAGLSISCLNNGPRRILLTDGNPNAVKCLLTNISLNRMLFSGKLVGAKLLLWETNDAMVNNELFDIILCADCLYETSLHAHLLQTIRNTLKVDGGVCYIICPERGNSLRNFVQMFELVTDMVIKESPLEPHFCEPYYESLKSRGSEDSCNMSFRLIEISYLSR